MSRSVLVRAPHRRLAAVLGAAIVAAAAMVVPAGAVTPLPTFQKVVAPPGFADMYPVDVSETPAYYYVLDAGRYRIERVVRATGLVDKTGAGKKGRLLNQIGDARAIANDAAGNVYVADTPNNRIVKYNADLTPMKAWGARGAGDGQFKNQSYGVAIGRATDAGPEIVYAVDGGGRVEKFDLDGVYLGEFGSGVLVGPRQITVHPVTHDIYVVDAKASKVVIFGANGAKKGQFGSAGTGTSQFNGDPRGISISTFANPAGLVYVSDQGNVRIQVFNSAGGFVGQFGSTGACNLVEARGLAATADGKILVTDEWGYGLDEFTVNSATSYSCARTLFGTPPPVDGVNTPRGIAVDAAGQLFIDDYWNMRIQRRNSDGSSPFNWGQRGVKTTNGAINFAWDVAVQPGTGNIFLANRESNQIEVFTAAGGYVNKWGQKGAAPGQIANPQGVAFKPGDAAHVYVADTDNHRIQRFNVDGAGLGTFDAAWGSKIVDNTANHAGQFNAPTGVDVADDGTVWVADTLNGRVQRRNPSTGAWTAIPYANGDTRPALTRHFKAPWGVTVEPGTGNIWIADSGQNRIAVITPAGDPVMEFTGTAVGAGAFLSPSEVEFGLNGLVYVSDTFNNRVVAFQH